MANVFQLAVERLIELGFYNFLLPFILFTTLMYAVLKKTKVLGDSIIVHAIISLSAGLMIFGLPVIVGYNITESLTAFVSQVTIVILVLMMGFIVAGFFYKDIGEKIGEIFKAPGPGAWVIWVVFAFAIMFGLFSLLGKPIKQMFSSFNVSAELMGMTIVLIIVFVVILIVSIAGGKEVK